MSNAATNVLGPYEGSDKECHGNSVHSIMQHALLLVLVIIQAVQLYSAVCIQLRLYGHNIWNDVLQFCLIFMVPCIIYQ